MRNFGGSDAESKSRKFYGVNKVRRALETLLPGSGEQLEESLNHGVRLRLFYCKCGKLYVGPNYQQCDECVSKRDEPAWPGRSNKKRGR